MAAPMLEAEARGERRVILRTYGALMGLLALTIAVAQVDLGWGNVVANLGIAFAKALLILWVFMHLREATAMLRLFSVAVLMWLLILFILGLGDWVTRGPQVP